MELRYVKRKAAHGTQALLLGWEKTSNFIKLLPKLFLWMFKEPLCTLATFWTGDWSFLLSYSTAPLAPEASLHFLPTQSKADEVFFLGLEPHWEPVGHYLVYQVVLAIWRLTQITSRLMIFFFFFLKIYMSFQVNSFWNKVSRNNNIWSLNLKKSLYFYWKEIISLKKFMSKSTFYFIILFIWFLFPWKQNRNCS